MGKVPRLKSDLAHQYKRFGNYNLMFIILSNHLV